MSSSADEFTSACLNLFRLAGEKPSGKRQDYGKLAVKAFLGLYPSDLALDSKQVIHGATILALETLFAGLSIFDDSECVSLWPYAKVYFQGHPLGSEESLESLAELAKQPNFDIAARFMIPHLIDDAIYWLEKCLDAGNPIAGYARQALPSYASKITERLLEGQHSSALKPFGDFWTRSEVTAQLELKDFEIDYLISRRYIICVKSWDESERFPPWQFLSGPRPDLGCAEFPRVRADVADILRGTSLKFAGWKAVAWFWANGLSDADRQEINNFAHWRLKLSEIGLWQEDWRIDSALYFEEFRPSLNVNIPKDIPLYRVVPAWIDSDPCGFSIARSSSHFAREGAWADGVDKRNDNGELRASDGRFDPLYSDDEVGGGNLKGSAYFTRDEQGCWTEVLDREPAIFLSDIVGRSMWRCTPGSEVTKIVDISDLSVSLSASPARSASQAFARRVLDKDRAGISYVCRSRASSSAVVLFGQFYGKPGTFEPDWKQNTHDPEAGGKWSYEKTTYQTSLSGWLAAERISVGRAGHAVLMRRFPPE